MWASRSLSMGNIWTYWAGGGGAAAGAGSGARRAGGSGRRRGALDLDHIDR